MRSQLWPDPCPEAGVLAGQSGLRLTAAPFQAGGVPVSPCCTRPPPTSTAQASAACTTARTSSSRGGRRGTGGSSGRHHPYVVSTASLGIPGLRRALLKPVNNFNLGANVFPDMLFPLEGVWSCQKPRKASPGTGPSPSSSLQPLALLFASRPGAEAVRLVL